MGREFLEQPLPTKLGIGGGLGFLYNISMTGAGPKDRHRAGAADGPVGPGADVPVQLCQPEQPGTRQDVLVVRVVHLWVEGTWELILGAAFGFVAGQDHRRRPRVIDKWLYVIITLALVTGIRHRPPLLLHRPAGLLEWVGSVFSRTGADSRSS